MHAAVKSIPAQHPRAPKYAKSIYSPETRVKGRAAQNESNEHEVKCIAARHGIDLSSPVARENRVALVVEGVVRYWVS